MYQRRVVMIMVMATTLTIAINWQTTQELQRTISYHLGWFTLVEKEVTKGLGH